MEYDIKTKKGMNETVIYFKKGTKILHRENGPAIESVNGYKAWYFNGEPHRIDGPAVDWVDGYKEWWIDGERLSPEKETILNQWWDNKNGL